MQHPDLLALTPLHALECALAAGGFPRTTSILLCRHGQLAYEAYPNGSTTDTLRDTRSVTKTVASMLVGIAIDEGHIPDVTAPILSFFPDRQPVAHANLRKDAITVEDFLTMSSALACDDSDDDSPGNEERMYPTDDWLAFTLNLPLRPPAPSAERAFSYCTAGVTTLAGILERATGLPVPEYARQCLFDPLGIAVAEWKYSPRGLAMTGGGLQLQSRDLAKLGQLYLDGGRWRGAQVVPEAWVRKSTRPHARVDATTTYGYLWWLRDFVAAGTTIPAWYMSGNGGNKVVVAPTLGLVAVITSTNYNTQGMHQQSERLLTDFILPAAILAQPGP
jgi:CubicO group peptidase (beta-lactamase class C family)